MNPARNENTFLCPMFTPRDQNTHFYARVLATNRRLAGARICRYLRASMSKASWGDQRVFLSVIARHREDIKYGIQDRQTESVR